MSIKRLSPDTLHKNPAYSQAIKVSAPATMVYVGGQNGVKKDGKMAGDTLAVQTDQALKNVDAALKAAGATFDDVIKMSLYIVQGQSLQEGFEAAQKSGVMSTKNPPIVTMMFVAGLANPDFLIEVEAVAALSDEQ